MALNFALFVSKRAQRIAAAFLVILLAQTIVASCTPEPVMPYAVRITVER
ncbi:hypothetical protein PQU98_02225 [Asticcacaulis sp. LKC15W]|uniref:Uncharacterized protein n=1 Tax=Asticcacaulis machinosus TaxID=2984211 RepID=A0ABT5HF98_9CAUL|nr:hypothetical protein [Asticcacaulis machinosus]MDC7674929.1 hypothetical protein [Asticcacaulis machinosus]